MAAQWVILAMWCSMTESGGTYCNSMVPPLVFRDRETCEMQLEPMALAALEKLYDLGAQMTYWDASCKIIKGEGA